MLWLFIVLTMFIALVTIIALILIVGINHYTIHKENKENRKRLSLKVCIICFSLIIYVLLMGTYITSGSTTPKEAVKKHILLEKDPFDNSEISVKRTDEISKLGMITFIVTRNKQNKYYKKYYLKETESGWFVYSGYID